MKGFIKRVTALCLALALSVCLIEMSDVNVRAEENETVAAVQGEDFLKEVIGEYVPLFIEGIFDSKYDSYWHDYTAAVVGESMADMGVAMMKKAIGGTTYGDNAGEDFFCGYTEDVVKIEFGGADGSKVTFTKKDGKKITHEYSFVKAATAYGVNDGQEMGMDGILFKSKDGNNDEFAYLFMCMDTPATTYHLEFRYGSSEEDILKLTDGKYKNWLIAGFPADAFDDPNETLIKQVIALFVIENMAPMSGEEADLERASMSGAWTMDTSMLKDYPGYENASMFMELGKNGTGRSYVDMAGTGAYMLASEYPYYIYATEKTEEKESGVYVVLSEDEGVKTAAYTISDIDGVRTLVFDSIEGQITYFYLSALKLEEPAISKVKVKSNNKIKLFWKSVEYADGYEMVISANENFKKSRTYTVAGKTSVKTKKLKGKNYFVKVRAYTVDYAGNKVYGDFSEVKTVTLD